MDNGIYIVLSRQLGLFRDMDTIANNLANVNTTGYRSHHLLFEQYLVDDGKRNTMAFTNDVSSYDDTRKGNPEITGNSLDVMINSQGFFSVETPSGRRYTRAGNFQINNAGVLITNAGYPVLDTNGQRIEFSEEDRNILIGSNGNLSVNGEDRATLGVYEFENPYAIKRGANQLYSAEEETPIPSTDPRVAQYIASQGLRLRSYADFLGGGAPVV